MDAMQRPKPEWLLKFGGIDGGRKPIYIETIDFVGSD